MDPTATRDLLAREWTDVAAEPADVADVAACARDLVSSRPLTVPCRFARCDPMKWVTRQDINDRHLPHRNELMFVRIHI